MNEHDARRILFFRALDQADREKAVLGDTLKRATLSEEAANLADAPPSKLAAAWSEALERKLSARLQVDLSTYYRSLSPLGMFAMAVICLIVGLFSNYLGTSGRVNVLLNPFMILVFWNVGLYLILLTVFLISRFRRENPRKKRQFPMEWWFAVRRFLPRVPLPSGGNTAILNAARVGFARLWLSRAPELARFRLSFRLHLMAAMLMMGVILGMYLHGLVQAFQFTWESTFLVEQDQVNAFLNLAFGPVMAVFGPGRLPAFESLETAPQWIHLFARAGVFYVIIPRLVLAFYARTQERRHAKRIDTGLKDPYFVELLHEHRGGDIEIKPLLYAFHPEEDEWRSLTKGLAKHYGRKAKVQQPIKHDWGEPASNLTLNGKQFELPLCFNGEQTPEDEIHGTFLTDLRRDNPGLTFTVFVSGWRTSQRAWDTRQNAWADLLKRFGNPPVVWVQREQKV